MAIHVHTSVTLSLDSKVDGKKLRDMNPQEMCNALRACGNKDLDIVVKDGDKEVAGYDSESGNVYYHMTVKEAFFTAIGLEG